MSKVPAVIQSTISNLVAAQASTPQDIGGDFQFLKMSKTGDWVYGADETEVSDDSVFVIDPNSYVQGFIAWDDGELEDEVMAQAGQPPITKADLKDGLKWDVQVGFGLVGIEGAEKGIQMLFKSSSKGGKSAISELLAKIIKRGTAGETDICPIVILENTSYKHKKYGKIFTPVLSVDDWTDGAVAEVEQVDTEAPEVEVEVEKEVKPTTRKRRTRKSA